MYVRLYLYKFIQFMSLISFYYVCLYSVVYSKSNAMFECIYASIYISCNVPRPTRIMWWCLVSPFIIIIIIFLSLSRSPNFFSQTIDDQRSKWRKSSLLLTYISIGFDFYIRNYRRHIHKQAQQAMRHKSHVKTQESR